MRRLGQLFRGVARVRGHGQRPEGLSDRGGVRGRLSVARQRPAGRAAARRSSALSLGTRRWPSSRPGGETRVPADPEPEPCWPRRWARSRATSRLYGIGYLLEGSSGTPRIGWHPRV